MRSLVLLGSDSYKLMHHIVIVDSLRADQSFISVKKLQRYKLVRDAGMSMVGRACCFWITIFLGLLLK